MEKIYVSTWLRADEKTKEVEEEAVVEIIRKVTEEAIIKAVSHKDLNYLMCVAHF